MKSIYFCVSKPYVILIRPLNVNIYQGRPIVVQLRFCFLQKSIVFKRIYAGGSPLWNLDFTYVFCVGPPPMECWGKWGANRSNGGSSLNINDSNWREIAPRWDPCNCKTLEFLQKLCGGGPPIESMILHMYIKNLSRGESDWDLMGCF